jgi:hypothetical protein
MGEISRGTVVCIAEIHWHFAWQVHHEVAAGLAGIGYDVYFLSTWPRRWRVSWGKTRKYLSGRMGLKAYHEGAYSQPVPAGVRLVPPHGIPEHRPLERWFNRHIIVPRLIKRLRSRGLKHPLTVINYVPLSYALAIQRALAPDASIYYCVSDWENVIHTRTIRLYERELIQMSDTALTSAPFLSQHLKELGAQPVFRPEGKNYDMFEPTRSAVSTPRERPLCAYFGNIGMNTDGDLLARVSQRYPLRIIGSFNKPVEGLSADTEIIPPVPHHELPRLLADVDVLLMPYDANAPHMRGVFPAKTFECLATGKPIVMMGLQYFDDFADVMTICHSADEFLDAIERVVREDTPALRERRLQRARENTDKAMIDFFDQTIQEIAASKQAATR